MTVFNPRADDKTTTPPAVRGVARGPQRVFTILSLARHRFISFPRRFVFAYRGTDDNNDRIREILDEIKKISYFAYVSIKHTPLLFRCSRCRSARIECCTQSVAGGN